ncbi:hypothetical protein B0H13DRAFT_1885394 [Mycena leptocephala]|nr:hypothetical protein B0H13DRAFT_1885394 [Mycena leptocephala]
MTVTREVFSRELLQNQSDSSSAAGRAASFFRVTQGYKKRGCRKSGCGGGPVSGKGRGPPTDGPISGVRYVNNNGTDASKLLLKEVRKYVLQKEINLALIPWPVEVNTSYIPWPSELDGDFEDFQVSVYKCVASKNKADCGSFFILTNGQIPNSFQARKEVGESTYGEMRDED